MFTPGRQVLYKGGTKPWTVVGRVPHPASDAWVLWREDSEPTVAQFGDLAPYPMTVRVQVEVHRDDLDAFLEKYGFWGENQSNEGSGRLVQQWVEALRQARDR